MSKHAGWVTGGTIAALGVVVSVTCIGREDRHAPRPAVLRSDVSALREPAPFSSFADDQSGSILAPITDGGVHIHIHLPADVPAATPLQSAAVEQMGTARTEVRM